ncbi:MAG: DUF3859 domain-containing protein [Lentisphaeria bacterium]|nr:DUF3859 domain-containing protein [Lentisphaeria bacterium]
MPKKKIEVEYYSFGIYDGWEPDSDQIPQIVKHTTKIPAQLGLEFGYVIDIHGARGQWLDFQIDHPPFKNEKGNIAPSFKGKEYISSAEYRFFVGDTFWEPIQDKVGKWTLSCWIQKQLVAQKTFQIFIAN